MRSVPGAVATGSPSRFQARCTTTRSLPLPVLTPCCPRTVPLQIGSLAMLREKPLRGETMNRVTTIAFHSLVASFVFWSCLATGTQAQTPSPSPAPSATPAAPVNPFAPQPAPPLPAGMTGSDVNDPRAKLSPGMYDAGETAMGIKHLMLLKKPDAFELGSNDPNDPK